MIAHESYLDSCFFDFPSFVLATLELQVECSELLVSKFGQVKMRFAKQPLLPIKTYQRKFGHLLIGWISISVKLYLCEHLDFVLKCNT